MVFLRALVFVGLSGFLVTGCSSNGREISASEKISGKVVLPNGQPARDVQIYFQPLDTDGRPETLPVGTDGSFSGEMVPGKYAFAIQPAAGKAAAHKAIPSQYHEANMKHQVSLSGGNVEIKLNPE